MGFLIINSRKTPDLTHMSFDYRKQYPLQVSFSAETAILLRKIPSMEVSYGKL